MWNFKFCANEHFNESLCTYNKFILNTDEGIWNFVIHRVYSRDELLPLLEKCVDILGAAIDGSESKGYVNVPVHLQSGVCSFFGLF